ncbi:Ribosome hibernation promoting factor Hpf [hydrothermal vent metagenome]|uniref:Ribosome hibernation promoting factor Hpf n=1 Tax=hydrothermal vent metagenome TaxID=652676 RepID=A0A3B0SED7_9ZZZZ
MNIIVTGKQMDIGESLKSYVEGHIDGIVDKYFEHTIDSIDGTVTMSKNAHLHRADCNVHLGHGVYLQTHAEEKDVYAAFDAAAEKMEKRLRRYKRRLTNHHKERPNEARAHAAQYNVFKAEPEAAEEANENLQPAIIAEMQLDIPEVSVSDAVMRLDLGELQTLMFRNSAHGGLNVVYRRSDGNIGWIDPKLD